VRNMAGTLVQLQISAQFTLVCLCTDKDNERNVGIITSSINRL
jgi:hypothetical protein